MAAEVLNVRAAAPVLDDAARAAYERARRHDTTGGLATIDEALAGAQLFEVVHAGQVVARYALRAEQHAGGVEVAIVAAAADRLGAIDWPAHFLPVIEGQIVGAQSVRITTKRKPLVNKLLQLGYRLDAFVLRKPLTVNHDRSRREAA